MNYLLVDVGLRVQCEPWAPGWICFLAILSNYQFLKHPLNIQDLFLSIPFLLLPHATSFCCPCAQFHTPDSSGICYSEGMEDLVVNTASLHFSVYRNKLVAVLK